MGYTHYWHREEEIEKNIFAKIISDFKKVLLVMEKNGIKLAGPHGTGEPIIDNEKVIFNGASNCGHEGIEISIPWPTDNAGGVALDCEDTRKGHWFVGDLIEKRTCDGNCAYETFAFPRTIKKKRLMGNDWVFGCCKTAFRPYDLAIISFLIIAKHYLGERISVKTDGKDANWFDGKMLCQIQLGYGLEYNINKKGALL